MECDKGLFRKPAKPDYSLLKGIRAYDVRSRPEPEQNPPQSISGSVPWKLYPRPNPAIQAYEREIQQIAQYIGRRGVVDWELVNGWLKWEITAREAAEALTQIAQGSVIPEPVGESGDGIAPCGYEEL